MNGVAIKTYVHKTVDPDIDGGLWYDHILIGVILANIGCLILRSLPNIRHSAWGDLLEHLEDVATVIFLIDILLRFWACAAEDRFKGLFGKVRYLFVPWTFIDAVVLGFGMACMFGMGGSHIAAPIRSLRLLRIGRYFEPLKLLFGIIHRKRKELLATLSMACLFVLFSSTAMFFAENAAQPDKFSSIPASMWWGVVTLTTIGYGDVFPITVAGKMIAGIMSVVSVGIIALPTAILGSALLEKLDNKPDCPTCGKNMS